MTGSLPEKEAWRGPLHPNVSTRSLTRCQAATRRAVTQSLDETAQVAHSMSGTVLDTETDQELLEMAPARASAGSKQTLSQHPKTYFALDCCFAHTHTKKHQRGSIHSLEHPETFLPSSPLPLSDAAAATPESPSSRSRLLAP